MKKNQTRSQKKRLQRARVFMSPARALGFVPDQFKTTMRYADRYTLTSTSGAISRYEWVANNLYDPDYTSTGHQPYGFDQMMGLYQYGVVHACRATAKIIGDSGYPAMFCLLQFGSVSYSAPTNIGKAVEIAPKEAWGITMAYSPLTLRASSTTEEFCGIPYNQQLAETTLYSSNSSGPTLYWYLRLIYQTSDATTTSSVTAMVELEFDITFIKTLQPGTS